MIVPAVMIVAISCQSPRDTPESAIGSSAAGGDSVAIHARNRWVADVDSFMLTLSRLDTAVQRVSTAPASAEEARLRFRAARLAFKRVEFIASYYEPSTTASLNGPPLPRVEYQEGPEVVFPPEGLQVIEEWLFTGADTARREQSVNEVRNTFALARRLRTATAAQIVTDNRVWDAASLEVARVVTLGITGFDSPVAQHSLPEAAAALRGTHQALLAYTGELSARVPGAASTLDAAFTGAIAALDSSKSFADFDRLAFIVAYANPLARAIQEGRKTLRLTPPEDRRAFRSTASTLFDQDAIDPQAFAHPQNTVDSPGQVALGRELFFDARLSGDGVQSCASCHDPSRAFTDGVTRSASRVSADAATMRNTPTVINAGLQNGLFYDLRTMFLEDQVDVVLSSRNEMHSSAAQVATRFSSDSQYVQLFRDAFPTRKDSAISPQSVRTAIAAYVRSLTAMNTPVDRALRGDSTALDASEKRGFNLYAGRAKCASCHFLPLFNGSVPPTYRSTDVEVLGVPSRPVTHNARIDGDSGRIRVTRSAPHLFAFKTPGLRNVALTAPYMHNGVYRTLEEVVDFYNRGGGTGIGIALGNQTLPFDSLGLTAAEQRDIVSFLRALTDTVGTTARPALRPSLSQLSANGAALRP
ncbi:MAG: cytochrome C peroxidase [Phycisphaerae bacterium]|nr:cytochrome C peroxidase [Gemmatimonadaceae bacterium]